MREPNMLEIIESDRLKYEWTNESKTTYTTFHLGTFVFDKPNDIISETKKLEDWWWELDSGEMTKKTNKKMWAIDRAINNMWNRHYKSKERSKTI